MAEIDTVSSHTPWAPLPAMVPWDKIGDGSIFDSMPARSGSPITVWRNSSTVRQFYGRSIQYSLQALTSWVTELNDPNLVLILLGDEQPGSPSPAPRASHEVPISIVAHDPSVFRQIASWHWQDGLLPDHFAPLRVHGRLPQPVPRRLQHGLVPKRRRPIDPQPPNHHGERASGR